MSREGGEGEEQQQWRNEIGQRCRERGMREREREREEGIIIAAEDEGGVT